MRIRKTIAAVLVLVFALVALPTLLLRSVASTYMQPNFYKGEVVEQTYEYVIEYVGQEVMNEEDIRNYFTQKEIEQMLKDSIPLSVMEGLAGDFAGQLQSIYDGRKDDTIVVSLKPIKDSTDTIAENVAQKVMSGIPACEVDEEDEIEVTIEYVDNKPTCIPPDFDTERIMQTVKHDIEKELNDRIPGEFTLELATEESDQANLKQIISFIDYLQIILPLFLLVMVLLIALFVYTPYSLVSLFTGIALLLAGVFGLIAAQLLRRLPFIAVTPARYPEFNEQQLSYVREIYVFFMHFIVNQMSTYAAYFLGIGLVVVLFGLYLRHFHEHTRRYRS
ncbi:hypothetical protein GF369_02345 [Candidatus Peregrinibacteria bacterium]|nr:hypothetical protein [Candidatus Peregrinibacteria bacterium]